MPITTTFLSTHSAIGRHIHAAACICALAAFCAHAAELQQKWLDAEKWNALSAEYSPLANPALLTKTHFISVRASLSSVREESYAHELGVTFPLGIRQSAGITWMMHAFNSTLYYQGLRDNLEDRANLYLLSYAINPWQPLHLGLNANLAYESYDTQSGRGGFGTDVGIAYDIIHHHRLGLYTLGVTGQNLVSPNMVAGFRFLRVAVISLLTQMFDEKVETSWHLKLTDPFGIEEDASRVSSDERWNFNGRITYRAPFALNFHLLGSFNPSGLSHIGIAGAFEIPSFTYGRARDALAIGYEHAWMTPSADNEISLFFRTEAGNHRLTAPYMLTQAFALYHEDKYWDALCAFGRIMAEYPNFHKNDIVSYYMAQCERELLMNAQAARRYKKLKEQYPASDLIRAAELGLMRVYYSDKNFDGVKEQYDYLSTRHLPDSMKYRAAYLMGQAYMQQNKYVEAKELFNQIPKWHADYAFARHSQGVAFFALNQPDSAEYALQKCIRFSPYTYYQQEIINRSRILLGYYYMELASEADSGLAKATLMLRKVTQNSRYFEEALLGMGWASFQAGEYDDCIRASERLGKSTHPALQAEGLMLHAYSLYAQKQYAKAAKLLGEADKALDKAAPPSPEEAAKMARHFSALKNDYDSFSQTIDLLAISRRVPRVRRAINSATEEQRRFAEKIKAQQVFGDNVARQKFIGGDLDKLREDIQYALASATYLMHEGKGQTSGKPGIREQLLEKRIEKYEKEIEKLETEE